MELDFSFFGFSPNPKIDARATKVAKADSKLSLRKKDQRKMVGESVKLQSVRMLTESTPLLNITSRNVSPNERAVDFKPLPIEKQQESSSLLSPTKSIGSNTCWPLTQSSDHPHPYDCSSSPRSMVNKADMTAVNLALKSRPTSKYNNVQLDLTTIVISDSSTCSDSESEAIQMDPFPHHISIPLEASQKEPISQIIDIDLSRMKISTKTVSELIETSKKDEVVFSSSCSTESNLSSKQFSEDVLATTIVLETSESESEHTSVVNDRYWQEPMQLLGEPNNLTFYDYMTNEKPPKFDQSPSRFQEQHLSSPKFQDIQNWLTGNLPSCKSVSPDHGSTGSVTKPISVTNGSDTVSTLDSSASKNRKHEEILSRSCENILTQLYGLAWRTNNSLPQKAQNDLKKPSRAPSSSPSNDSTDSLHRFLQKCKRKSNKLSAQNLEFQIQSHKALNDNTMGNENLEFYEAVLNTRFNEVLGTNTKKVDHLSVLNSPKQLPMYSSRRLSFSDEEDSSSAASVLVPKLDSLKIRKKVSKNDKSHPKLKAEQLIVKTVDQLHTMPLPPKSNAKVLPQAYSFLESLSASTPASYCHPEAHNFKINFKKRKEELCVKLFTMFNCKVFDCVLPEDLKIEWNVRLQRTAGLCFNQRVTSASGEKIRTSRIELSTKVCDSSDRLRDTLIHELCHAATWIIHGVQTGHGHYWKTWARKAIHCYPELAPIERCHDYKIQTKFTYKCTCCGYCVGRHSKSLNIDTKRCGYCHGKFELLIHYKKKTGNGVVGTPTTPRNPNHFALFVKENYSSVKSTRRELKHGEVMKLLGEQFSVAKISNQA